MAGVNKEGQWGFINTEGKEIIPLTYDEIDDFDEKGFAFGVIDEEVYVVFKNGREVPFKEIEKESRL